MITPYEIELIVAHMSRVLNLREDNDRMIKVKKIPIGFADGTVETDTDFTFPAKAVVLPDCFIDVTVAEATGGTKTIDVGTSTVSDDPDGFLDGIAVDALGIIKGTLADGAATLGALLRTDESSGDLVPELDETSLGAVVSWTPGSNDFAELAADIYICYIDLTVPS